MDVARWRRLKDVGTRDQALPGSDTYTVACAPGRKIAAVPAPASKSRPPLELVASNGGGALKRSLAPPGRVAGMAQESVASLASRQTIAVADNT